MTVFVAVSGFFLLPDNPGDTKVFWLSPEQNALSRARMNRVNKLPPTLLTWAKLKQVFASYKIYLFTLAYATWTWSQNRFLPFLSSSLSSLLLGRSADEDGWAHPPPSWASPIRDPG